MTDTASTLEFASRQATWTAPLLATYRRSRATPGVSCAEAERPARWKSHGKPAAIRAIHRMNRLFIGRLLDRGGFPFPQFRSRCSAFLSAGSHSPTGAFG